MKKQNLINGTLFLLGMVSFVLAGTDGTVRGRVTDVEGNPLPGAQVYIKKLAIGSVANIDGNYLILNIPIGTYDVTVEMMGYRKEIVENVEVIMDKTIWLNFSIPVAAIEGEVVHVVGERELVEKGTTAKKITVDKETIEALPLRDITELYTLQSGVVKVVSRTQGIPDHEERGLEEVHVRGGRSGEIAYMIDGLYIRNPIFGGIGNGTRLNLFAVKEFDWQPGGFNAEYGDAMSAVSNMHTNSGGDQFQFKYKYETSLVGAGMGSEYDALRGYNDFNLGFGGAMPGYDKIRYWVSGQYTDHRAYQVYEFDDKVFINGDPGNDQNRRNLVQPWDDEAGFRDFGFDRTWDIFSKLSYNPTNKLRFNFSYWRVAAHRKGFKSLYLYWDNGQNELFRDTHRFTFELNQTLTSRTFYTLRLSRFVQDKFQGVRWSDSDNDGYPDWFEWRHPAGPNRSISDPYNPNVVPYLLSENGDTVRYTMKDEWSGWYYGATPGIYNWEVAEDFTDMNGNGLYDPGIDEFNSDPNDPYCQDTNGNGVWDGPEFAEKCTYRDGDYWLTPEMYEGYTSHYDYFHLWTEYEQDPYWESEGSEDYNNPPWYENGRYPYSIYGDYPDTSYADSLYYLPGGGFWLEGRAFGGHDRFYGTSQAVTNELRFDITSQLTDEWKVRTGFDYKSHKLNFYEVKNPWLGDAATTQSFAEYWHDTGPDGLLPTDADYPGPDFGEGNGQWDSGEAFDDANENGKWDDFREPEEISAYIQNTFEVPWMVMNAGIRIDAVNYNTRIWADTLGKFSPGRPWFFADVGEDGRANTDDIGEDDGVWNYNESASDDPGFPMQKVIFKPSEWFYKISPRLGFSHVITDQATFTFSYGLYYQTPIFQNVYLNTNRLEDPEELFEEGEGYLGNATMNASRTQSYEFGFNFQVGRHWRFSILGWLKDMDQLVTYKYNQSGVYEYQVFDNGDYGSAKGIDFTLENRGMLINTMIQYTYSIAKANSEHDWATEGLEAIDAPSQEFRMPYDRPHDLTVTLYTRLPLGINASLTGFYLSGYPYTPMIFNGDKPQWDVKNKYSKRAPDWSNVNLSLSKYLQFRNIKISLGLNVYNLFNMDNAIDIWPLTGKPDDPGEYYLKEVALPINDGSISGSFYDMPWMFASPREINFFVRFDFR